MEITFIGHSCFKIKGKVNSVVIDPYDPKIGYKLPKLEAELLLTTHDHFDHANVEGVTGYKLLINGPGEYEMNDTLVYGLPLYHDDKQGELRGKETAYLMDIDGFSILHLGDLGHVLSEENLEKISDVDVLLIPVGGKYTIDAKTAVKVISSLEPHIVIPMHYKTEDLTGVEGLDGVEKFLAEMGIDPAAARYEEKLKLNSKSDLPEDTQVVVLKPTH